MIDWAHTPAAASARRRKAVKLARLCWGREITAADVAGMGSADRAQLAVEAGVNPPSTSETWQLVTELLTLKTIWALAHPDDPRSRPLSGSGKEAR